MEIDIAHYTTTPPATSIYVDYRTVKEGFERYILSHPEAQQITEEEFFRMLYNRLVEHYYLLDEICLCIHFPYQTYEDIALMLTKARLERLGYKTVFYEDQDEFFFCVSLDIINAAYDHHPERIILITNDPDLGSIPLILSHLHTIPLQYEIWHFLGAFDRQFFQTLTEEGITMKALDILLFI